MKTTTNRKGEKPQVEGCAAPLITPASTTKTESTTNGGKSKTETKSGINMVKNRNNGEGWHSTQAARASKKLNP